VPLKVFYGLFWGEQQPFVSSGYGGLYFFADALCAKIANRFFATVASMTAFLFFLLNATFYCLRGVIPLINRTRWLLLLPLHLATGCRHRYLGRVTLTLELSQHQTEFNVRRWNEILGDQTLAGLPYRIETNRHGHILMSPPPAASHGKKQAAISHLLVTLLPNGTTITECPISTSDGVKAADVAWLAPGRESESERALLVIAPDICVEILSPSNTRQEIEEKIELYFEANAKEVWVCDILGNMSFRVGSATEPAMPQSTILPTFPLHIP
jgi:Uma2 family endonuclease